jgi:hypothetical protein
LLWLTATSNGPPDQRLSKFKVIVSDPAGPDIIAARRPLPMGYVALMISLARAGDLDHKDFAFMICASESKVQSRNDFPAIFDIIRKIYPAKGYKSSSQRRAAL